MDITRRLLQLVGAAAVIATRRAKKAQPKLRIASVTAWQVVVEKTWTGTRWV